MYKVIGKENDMFKVLDLDAGTEKLLSASDLVFALSEVEIDGCRHSEHGIEVRYQGVDSYEIPIEVWKPVSICNRHLYDGSFGYWVSNLGNIARPGYYGFRGVYNESRLLKITRSASNYCVIGLTDDDGNRRNYFVHVLVATEFVPNFRKAETVNHRDECPWHNWAGNLEWLTILENVRYGTGIERAAKSRSRKIRQYTLDKIFVREWESSTVAARALGYSSNSGIVRCCNRRNGCKSYRGFIWRHVTDDEILGSVDCGKCTRVPLPSGRPKIPVRQYTLSGEFVAEYDSISEPERLYGFSGSSISKCCKRTKQYHKGYLWRYSNDDDIEVNGVSDAIIAKSNTGMRIRQYTKEGVFVMEHSSALEASNYFGCSRSVIYRYCQRMLGKVYYKGFILRYESDDEFADRPENAKAIEEWRKAYNVQSC